MKENKTLESHSKTMPEHGGTRKEVVKSTMPEQTKAKHDVGTIGAKGTTSGVRGKK